MSAHGSIHLRSRRRRASFGGRVPRTGSSSCGMTRIVSTLLAILLSAACAARDAGAPAAGLRPVVVQGAMDVEIRKLAGRIENAKEEKVQTWTFWTGTIDGYPVVVSKTLKGMPNAAVATSLAAERYHPIAIINQGTAGRSEEHTSELQSLRHLVFRLPL